MWLLWCLFQESFQVGINLSGQLHLSDIIRLRNEDSDISPYRSLSEPLLYYDGHIQLDIPIKVDGIIVQASDTERIRVLSCRKFVS